MELRPGLSALVTSGASGIGKALSLPLEEKGIFVTVVDFSEEKGKEVSSVISKANSKFHSNLGFQSAQFIKCDVTNSSDIIAAFKRHIATYGGLYICINCAGIINPIPFNGDPTDGTRSWRHTVNVNLIALIDCTRLAIKTMEAAQKPGVIINLGSSAGLYPSYVVLSTLVPKVVVLCLPEHLFLTNVKKFVSMCCAPNLLKLRWEKLWMLMLLM